LGLPARSNAVLFVLLGLPFFRSDVLTDRPVVRLGIRYGAAAVFLSFAVGIVMSVNPRRDIGDAGKLLAHGLGVHAIQTLPLVEPSDSQSPCAAPRGPPTPRSYPKRPKSASGAVPA
jgi:hypothetical protein